MSAPTLRCGKMARAPSVDGSQPMLSCWRAHLSDQLRLRPEARSLLACPPRYHWRCAHQAWKFFKNRFCCGILLRVNGTWLQPRQTKVAAPRADHALMHLDGPATRDFRLQAGASPADNLIAQDWGLGSPDRATLPYALPSESVPDLI